MERVCNFSAGPSILPESVLKQAQEDMLCYGTDGHVGYGDEPSLESL